MALEADVVVLGPAGQRRLRVQDFYAGLGDSSSVLDRAELVAEVYVSPPAPGATGFYLRHATRMTIDYPLVQVGVLLHYEKGVCRNARVVVGAVAPWPMRATRAEAILSGQRPSVQLAAQAGAEAAREVKPIPYIFRAPSYKRLLTRACVEEAILLAGGLRPAGDHGTDAHGGES
jgi:carbon-monoxide dehydrogenase medium subunit